MLAKVSEALERGGRAAVSGLGGMGKTQTVIEHAHRNRERYTSALWVRAESREALRASIGELARVLNLPEAEAKEPERVLAGVKRWLDARTGWLLVLDNADDIGVVRDVLPSPGRGHVLLTTRARNVAGFGTRIRLSEMGPEEGARLLLRRAGILTGDASLDQTAEGDRAAARTLSEEMDGLPLALDQAGAYIAATGIAPAEYLTRYRAAGKRLRARPAADGSHEHLTVARTFSLAFEAILKEDPADRNGSGGDGEEELVTLAGKRAAADLLRLCAFLAPDAIPEEILTEGAPELGEYLGQAAADWSVYDAMMEQAIRYSLLERDAATKTLSLHRLVQDVLKDEMDDATRRAWAERAVWAVSESFPTVEFSDWPKCDRLLPHALTCVKIINDESLESVEAARMLSQTASYLVKREQSRQSESLYQRAVETYQGVLGRKHPYTLTAQNNLALLYSSQGRYDEAEQLHKATLKTSKRVLGREHPDTLKSQINLALLYCEQNRLNEAESLNKATLKTSQHALGPEHTVTLTCQNHLAELYRAQRRYDEAETLHKATLESHKRVLGPEHPDTLVSQNNLALVYFEQERFDEAEPFMRQVATTAARIFPPAHPTVATFVANHAAVLDALGRTEEAKAQRERAAAIQEAHARQEGHAR